MAAHAGDARVLGAMCDAGVLWAALGAVAALVSYRVIYALYFSPLRHIPGPLLARTTRTYLEAAAVCGRLAEHGRQIGERYGDIAVCQPNSVCITDPADIRKVLSSPLCVKGDYYALLRFTGVDNMISMTHSESVSKRRRMLGPFFSTSYVGKMEPLIAQYGSKAIVQRWDALLAQSADGSATVNYGLTFGLCTFNIISRLVYGQEVAALDLASDSESLRWIHRSNAYLSLRALLQLFPRPVFHAAKWPFDHMYHQIADYIYGSIDARRRLLAALGVDDQRPADLLQALLDCEDAGSRVRLSSEEIHAESLLLMIGGVDPTAFTLIWTVHLLMLYPECYRRAVREVRGALPPGGSAEITYAAARGALPYLEACIQESMRLVPVASVMIPRTVLAPGLTLRGHHLPPGTTVFANMYGSHMSPRYWADPHRFDPARFLEPGSRRAHCVFTFGYGSRICLGKHMAWTNMLTIMATLLRRYDFALPAGYSRTGPAVIDPATGYPKIMPMSQFLSRKPADQDADCRVTISRASTG